MVAAQTSSKGQGEELMAEAAALFEQSMNAAAAAAGAGCMERLRKPGCSYED